MGFIEPKVGNDTHLILVDTSVRRQQGLRAGHQGKLYAKGKKNIKLLFKHSSVESVGFMSHPIAVAQTTYPKRHSVTTLRPYFIDDMREKQGLLTGTGWYSDTDLMVLKGLV